MKNNFVKEKLILRVSDLINKGDDTLKTEYDRQLSRVSYSDLSAFKAASLAFIEDIFGSNHSYYKIFSDSVSGTSVHDCKAGISILESIKNDIEGDWIFSLKDLVSGEIFSDFLDMGKYLLNENYKDASAVVIGSVLESHLRYLCSKNGIDTVISKGEGKNIPKKADLMNIELCKAGIYNMLQQKNIAACVDLRNNAAHGKYESYGKEEVRNMLNLVNHIITTYP
jgi:hypothetical protein